MTGFPYVKGRRIAPPAIYCATFLAVLAMAVLYCLMPFAAGPARARTFFDAQPAPGVFVHFGAISLTTPENRGDIANLTLIVGRDAAAVIDTGGSVAVGGDFLAAVRAITDKPIRYVINTHEHPDHIFGNPAFVATGATFVAHANYPAALGARWDHYLRAFQESLGAAAIAEETLVTPSLLVDGTMTLDLGDRPLRLDAWRPAAHTDCDLTVLDTASGTLIAGDLLFIDAVPVVDGSAKSWLGVLDRLRGLPAVRAVPGHGQTIAAWPAAIAPERRYLQALVDDARRAVAAGISLERAVPGIAAAERNNWRLFDDYNPRNATATYAEMEWE